MAQAIRLMLDHNISGLPVLRDGKVVGILTEGDLLRHSETGTERHRPRWLEILMTAGRDGRRVSQDARRRTRRDQDHRCDQCGRGRASRRRSSGRSNAARSNVCPSSRATSGRIGQPPGLARCPIARDRGAAFRAPQRRRHPRTSSWRSWRSSMGSTKRALDLSEGRRRRSQRCHPRGEETEGAACCRRERSGSECRRGPSRLDRSGFCSRKPSLQFPTGSVNAHTQIMARETCTP